MKKGTLGYCIIAAILIVGGAGLIIGRGIRNNRDKDTVKEKSDVQLVGIADAYNVDELLKSEYDNIELPDSLNIDKVDTIGNVSLKVPDYEEYNRGIDIQFFKQVIPQLGYEYDEKNVTDDGHKTYPYGRYYEQDAPYIYIATGCTGFFNVDTSSIYGGEVLEEFYVDTPYEDKEYELVGGKMKVSEAVEMYEKLELKYITELGYDIPIPKVFRVKLLKDDEGKLMYSIDTQMNYDGTEVFGINDTYRRSGFSYDGMMGGSGIITGKQLDTGIRVTYSGFSTEYVSSAPVDKIISVKTAGDLINRKLAAYKKNRLLDVKLEYLYFEEKGSEEISWTKVVSGNIATLKPFWIFVFDASTDKEIIGLVDCVTGDVGLVYNQ